MTSNTNYPGGSKARVNKAGDNVRAKKQTPEDIKVIEDWRFSHRSVLNTFQAMLRNRTKGRDILVAQRHKRRKTIFDKLDRLPSMQLARMDDVAGCRLIFHSIESLIDFREDFLRAKFKHRRRNSKEKYDYIATPKATGYRGIHDVYEYNVNSKTGASLAGLNIEIQYRTFIQHAWATAVEIIGSITENQPKFQRGDKRYERAMALASEILARAYENSKGPFPEASDREILQEFLALDTEIKLLNMLRGLNQASGTISRKKNVILIFPNDGELQIKSFENATDALKSLFQLENENPNADIVLVKADTTEQVQLAFRNYFSDAKEFIEKIDNAIIKLNHQPTKA
jgi:putative GTP pyrophosphokinase